MAWVKLGLGVSMTLFGGGLTGIALREYDSIRDKSEREQSLPLSLFYFCSVIAGSGAYLMKLEADNCYEREKGGKIRKTLPFLQDFINRNFSVENGNDKRNRYGYRANERHRIRSRHYY